MAERIQFLLTAADQTRAAFASVEASLGKLQTGAATVQSAFAGLAALGALGGLGASLRASITQLDDFNDAADKTGASVEELSAILNTLGATGATLEQVTDIAGKLTKAMAGADEETSKAGEAFKLLGVATRDTAGNLRPVQDVLQEVAVALNQYADGTNKTALSQALFGKSGADLLPILKDLATEQRRGATVTTEQAEQAERAQKALTRLTFEMQTMRNELAAALLPSLSDFLAKLRSIAAISSNPLDWAKYLVGSASDINAEVARIEGQIDRLQKVVESGSNVLGPNSANPGLGSGLLSRLIGEPNAARTQLLELQRQLQEAKAIQRTQRDLGVATAQPTVTGKSALFGAAAYGAGADKPNAPRLAAEATVKAQREQTSEAQRLLDTLQQQLDKTRSLTTEQEVLARIGRGEIDGLNPALEQQILLRAAQIDKLKEEQRAREDLKRAIESMAADEAKEQAALAATRMPLSARVADEAARILRELPSAQQAARAELTQYFDERFLDGLIPEAEWKAAIDRINGLQTNVKEQAAETNNIARDLGLTFQSAFEDAILSGEKLSTVLQGLGKDLARLIIRKSVTEPLANLAATTISGIFGGPRANGGPVDAGTTYLVGERGPELFVPKMAGTVVPNGAMGPSMSFSFQIAAGVTRQELLAATDAVSARIKGDILSSMRNGGAFAGA